MVGPPPLVENSTEKMFFFIEPFPKESNGDINNIEKYSKNMERLPPLVDVLLNNFIPVPGPPQQGDPHLHRGLLLLHPLSPDQTEPRCQGQHYQHAGSLQGGGPASGR